MKERVVVGMSGGVDSSVVAALLKDEGYEVIGATLSFQAINSRFNKRLSLRNIEDARRVCRKLKVKHYTFDLSSDFKNRVVKDFCRQYLNGRTPNPCVRCNEYIKFGALLKKARGLAARYLATGHYARIEKLDSPPKPRFLLKKARDLGKDQSYFLYRLNQVQLRHILFPLGNFTKEEVRALARVLRLEIADKSESQEICFLAGSSYREFLKKENRTKIKPGLIVDKQGHILGRHRGFPFYTIGQREGLGIAAARPLYVIRIDAKNNQLTVAEKEDAYASEFLVKEPHFILRPAKKNIAAKVRIRYNHREEPAQIIQQNNRIKIRFRKPQFAITCGQSAVFYDADTVLGGGIIDRVL